MMYLSAKSQSNTVKWSRGFITQAQLDGAQDASDTGHTLSAQKRTIVETDVARRSIYHKSLGGWRRWRGKGVVGGGCMDIDVPEGNEAGHGHCPCGFSFDGARPTTSTDHQRGGCCRVHSDQTKLRRPCWLVVKQWNGEVKHRLTVSNVRRGLAHVQQYGRADVKAILAVLKTD